MLPGQNSVVRAFAGILPIALLLKFTLSFVGRSSSFSFFGCFIPHFDKLPHIGGSGQ